MGLSILVVSDIHGHEETLPEIINKIKQKNADILVNCGDITHFGKPKGWTKWFIESIPVRVLAVPGNCDPPDEVLSVLEKNPDNNLHGRKIEIDGINFVGFGGSKVSPNFLPFEIPDEVIYENLDRLMVDNAVLVTHAPAMGHLDQVEVGNSLGSEAIARIVKKYKPMLSLSGHVHETRGIEREGNTVFVNPGPAKNGYAAFVKISDDRKVEAELI